MDWAQLTLFLYISMRMSGFVLFNPLLGRNNSPAIVRAGLVLVLASAVFAGSGSAAVAVPATLLELVVRLLLELLLGFAVGFVMHLFFMIPSLAGFTMDSQMGMSMASTYDAGSQMNSSVTSTLLNVLMILLFFAAGGHQTLFRILLTSGDVVAFGAVSLGADMANAMVELFIQTFLLAVQLSLPVLAAELIGQVGMGILMKAIPQINAFVINIELKVVLGLVLVLLLMAPFSDFLLEAERTMLDSLHQVLALAA